MTTAPYPWLKTVEAFLLETQQIPLWGNLAPFPWESCSKVLQEALQVKHLDISSSTTEWLSSEELGKGLGEDLFVLSIELSPLKETVYWIMPKEDISKLTSYVLSQDSVTKGFFDPRLKEGFYRFLALHAASAIDELNVWKEFSVKVGAPSALPKEGALCTDVRIACSSHTHLWGRVACPSPFLDELRAHTAKEAFSFSSSPLFDDIPLTLRLEAGSTVLSLAEWEEAQEGDILVLDRCSYDPEIHKGSFSLLLHDIPLFHLRAKDQALKILDYTFYHEEDMDEEIQDKEDKEELPEEEATEEHLWEAPTKEDSVEEALSSKEIPLTISVEVAKFTLPLRQLLELKPGNTLELSVHPEQGVKLTISGKLLAHGELVKMGDLLGVKILQVGKSNKA